MQLFAPHLKEDGKIQASPFLPPTDRLSNAFTLGLSNVRIGGEWLGGSRKWPQAMLVAPRNDRRCGLDAIRFDVCKLCTLKLTRSYAPS